VNEGPTRLHKPIVRDTHEIGVVIARQGLTLSARSRERDKLRVHDGRPSGLAQRAARSVWPEIARLASEADPRSVGMLEHDVKSEPVVVGRLRFLHAVTGDVRRVAQASQQARVRGREHLDLAHVALGAGELKGAARGAGQLGHRDHGRSARSVCLGVGSGQRVALGLPARETFIKHALVTIAHFVQ
jgi:hypothetical protein